MLLTLFIMPPVFYRAGKNTGQNLTHLRGQYRQQLTSWLQGRAELTIFGASKRYRAQMEATELQWHEAQRRQSELTALSQALMLLIGALAVMLMLWMASGGVGGNTQPGALIALFVFCALAAFEALAPVTGAFQHLGQVIASALRITELTEQKPEVTFPQAETPAPEKVTLTLRDVSFRYPDQPINALNALSLQANRRACRYSGAYRLRKINAVAATHPRLGPATRRNSAQRSSAILAERIRLTPDYQRGAAACPPVQRHTA